MSWQVANQFDCNCLFFCLPKYSCLYASKSLCVLTFYSARVMLETIRSVFPLFVACVRFYDQLCRLQEKICAFLLHFSLEVVRALGKLSLLSRENKDELLPLFLFLLCCCACQHAFFTLVRLLLMQLIFRPASKAWESSSGRIGERESNFKKKCCFPFKIIRPRKVVPATKSSTTICNVEKWL